MTSDLWNKEPKLSRSGRGVTAISVCLFKQIQVWNFSSSLISATYKAYLIFNEEAQASPVRLWNVTGAPGAVHHFHSFVRFTVRCKGRGQVTQELGPGIWLGAWRAWSLGLCEAKRVTGPLAAKRLLGLWQERICDQLLFIESPPLMSVFCSCGEGIGWRVGNALKYKTWSQTSK